MLFTLLLSVLSSLTFSSATCGQGSTLIFTNGILTDEATSTYVLNSISNKISTGVLEDSPDKIEKKLAYNTSIGVYDDVLEAMQQLQDEFMENMWLILMGRSTDASPEQTAAIRNIFGQSLSTTGLEQADVQGIVQEVKTAVDKGNRVLHVTHSQGGLFANKAYAALSPDYSRYYRAEQVATPASYLQPGMNYTTFHEDVVVGLARIPYQSLLGNVWYLSSPSLRDFNLQDLSIHMPWTYLNHTGSSAKIIADITGLVSGLEYPEPKNGKGPITATMTWSGATDVDLHIFEPNGFHVYYVNKNGQNGSLDVDNTYGYGPEHYYVTKCEDLDVGTFSFGVNYYSGTGAQLVRMVIETPDEQAVATTTLSTALGSGGDSSPTMLKSVVVTKNPNGRYKMVIQ